MWRVRFTIVTRLRKKKNYSNDTTYSICLFVVGNYPVGCGNLHACRTVHRADGVTAHVFKPLGVALADGGFQSTWGLFGILLLSALVAFCTIFLFRNRMLQIRMTIFSSILLIGYYIAFCVFMFILKGDLDAMTFQLGWALCLPVVAIILNYLAFRAIYKDEVMVKAADRLRR